MYWDVSLDVGNVWLEVRILNECLHEFYIFTIAKKAKAEVLSEPQCSHRPVLISDSAAFGQTPAKAASSQTQGQCSVQLLSVTEATGCEELT